MKITSMDITNKEFRKVLRGYDSEEVEEFLERVAEDYEALYKENSSLKEKVFVMNEKLDHYSKMEETIQNTLLLAQNAAEQAKLTSQREADMILKNANESAQRILDKANNEVIQVTTDYEKTKQEFFKFKAKYRNFMQTQLDMFESLENDFARNYNIAVTEDEYEQEESLVKDFNIKDINPEELANDNTLSDIKNFFIK